MDNHKPSHNNKILPTEAGAQAEKIACQYLMKNGLDYIDKNYRTNAGEIDLIMQDQEYRVFVEVRARQQGDYGSSIETVTLSKQQRIIRAAKHYLQKKELFDKIDCRFDVIGIDAEKITWIKNAFMIHSG